VDYEVETNETAPQNISSAETDPSSENMDERLCDGLNKHNEKFADGWVEGSSKKIHTCDIDDCDFFFHKNLCYESTHLTRSN
jgi:hypothetical protein